MRTSQGIVTRSDELVRANTRKQIASTAVPPFSYEAVKCFYRSIGCFCEKLLEVCKNKHIIIHEAYQTDNIKTRFRLEMKGLIVLQSITIVLLMVFLRKYY